MKPKKPKVVKKKDILPVLGNGLIAREVRVELGAVLALAGFFVIIIFIGWLGDRLEAAGGMRWLPEIRHPEYVWLILAMMLALLLGVLCGAEEQENETADFALRLPLTRMRIFLEKLCGAMIAFALWAVLSILLTEVLVLVMGGDSMIAAMKLPGAIAQSRMLGYAALWAVLLFSFGLAAGAWIGRVVPAAVAAGCAAGLYGWLVIFGGKLAPLSEMMNRIDLFHGVLLALGCGVALTAAARHFQRREGK
jgi:ABC-type transport system involved in multi-copper enzyme maturation permease subunit